MASGGGHWVELLRLRPALEGAQVTYVTVNREYAQDLEPRTRLRIVSDATRWDKVGLIWMALGLLWIVINERPHVVISTGAAPGYVALRLGRLVRARTIWVDSMANVEQLSMSGERAGRHADLWLTQWAHLARPTGPSYAGSVL